MANYKVSDRIVAEIRMKYLTGRYTHAMLGREYHLSAIQVGRICRGESRMESQPSRRIPVDDDIPAVDMEGIEFTEEEKAMFERIKKEHGG